MSTTASDLYLSPTQQGLLLAALNSNRPVDAADTDMASTRRVKNERTGSAATAAAPNTGPSSSFQTDPVTQALVNEDDAYNFEDSDLFGDLPDDSPEPEEDAYTHLHDKRKSFDAADDADEGGGKRQEGEDKTIKKPGRKPLTSEPTTKRKAQNRAAQRAFRERKEKHLKDLETKVEDLEKASEAANNENSVLKAQIERLILELNDYRSRVSWANAQGPVRRQSSAMSPRNSNFNPGTSDFHFQFPKFGATSFAGTFPSTATSSGQDLRQTQVTQPAQTPSTINTTDPRTQTKPSLSGLTSANDRATASSISTSIRSMPTPSPQKSQLPQQEPADSFGGLFSPSVLAATADPNGNYFGFDVNGTNVFAQYQDTNRGSFDLTQSAVPGLYFGSSASNTESPGSSHGSHQQNSISASPDTTFTSPSSKLQDLGLDTIPEQQSSSSTNPIWNVNPDLASNAAINGANWPAQYQNTSNFDPVVFGDYRETPENLLNQDFGSFFNDAYPLPDLGSPTHNYGSAPPQGLDVGKKASLTQTMDGGQDKDTHQPAKAPKLLTCNKIWDRLQSMEKFRNGEIDIDNLCSELRAKAKCSEAGAAVEEHHVNRILGLQ